MSEKIWDYVVVGGGSAGSVVAGRLAAAGARVLVLEAGGTDLRPDVLIPAGVVHLYTACNWSYRPEPDPSRAGTVEAWPAGRILGGGGSINATVFVRGNAADYDGWAEQGAIGWDYDSVLPAFRRMESWTGTPSEYRGTGGPIAVREHGMRHEANDAFLQAAQDSGYPVNDDYNGKSQDGVGLVQVNQRRGFRSQASRGYLRKVAGRRNLDVRTHAFVERVVLADGRAIGVEYRHRRRRKFARATGEVILSAGSIASPKLLMLSGVGPRDELLNAGVDVVLDSPGVGRNLQEHAGIMQRWLATVPTINKLRAKDIVSGVADWVRHGDGLLAATAFHVQAMHRTNPDAAAPNIQIAFSSFATMRKDTKRGPAVAPSRDQGFLVTTLLLHPRSRGRVRLRSSHPDAPPVIEHSLLGDDTDVAELIDGMAEARRIMRQPAMSELTSGMFMPERECRTDTDWERYLRDNATYGAHPVGTCRIGQDSDAVVDEHLNVRGAGGLRVVDASVMPTLPSGNTNAASMMIGERAAEFILQR